MRFERVEREKEREGERERERERESERRTKVRENIDLRRGKMKQCCIIEKRNAKIKRVRSGDGGAGKKVHVGLTFLKGMARGENV